MRRSGRDPAGDPEARAASFAVNLLAPRDAALHDAGAQPAGRPWPADAAALIMPCCRPACSTAYAARLRPAPGARLAVGADGGAARPADEHARSCITWCACPIGHFERNAVGVIAERLRQLDVLRGFFAGQLPALAIDLVFVALFLAAAVRHRPLAGPGRRWLAIPLLIACRWPRHRAQRRLADEIFQALAAKGSTLTETVANAATVKALGLEAEVEQRWQARVERAARPASAPASSANITASASAQPAAARDARCGAGRRARDRARRAVASAAWSRPTCWRRARCSRCARSRRPGTSCRRARTAFQRLDELMTEPVESPPGTPRADAADRGRASSSSG